MIDKHLLNHFKNDLQVLDHHPQKELIISLLGDMSDTLDQAGYNFNSQLKSIKTIAFDKNMNEEEIKPIAVMIISYLLTIATSVFSNIYYVTLPDDVPVTVVDDIINTLKESTLKLLNNED